MENLNKEKDDELRSNREYLKKIIYDDEQTQYSYFGARYYDSDLSVWLSVDPLANDFPSWTPYSYCFDSPIVSFDPDGKGPIDRAIKYRKKHGGTLYTWIGRNGRQYASVDRGPSAKVFKTNIPDRLKNLFWKLIPNINASYDGGGGDETWINERHESFWKDWNFDLNTIKPLLDIISSISNPGNRRIKKGNGETEDIPTQSVPKRYETDDNNRENFTNPGSGITTEPEKKHSGTIRYTVPITNKWGDTGVLEGGTPYLDQKDSSKKVKDIIQNKKGTIINITPNK